MNEVTRIINAIKQGDPQAPEKLLPLAYEELRLLAARKMAQEKPGHTLQATALVHKIYIFGFLKDQNRIGRAVVISLLSLLRPSGAFL